MSESDAFPLSPRQAKSAVILSVAYGLLVVVGASYYYMVSGDRRYPLPYLIAVSIAGVCAWGIHRRRRWAWAIAAAFSLWETFYGGSNLITLLNAGALGAAVSVKIIVVFLAIRTVSQLGLFIILVLLADHEKMFRG